MLHFLVDAVCAFVTVVFITELTKFLAGRLRPNFLQVCLGFQAHGCQLLLAVSRVSALKLGDRGL